MVSVMVLESISLQLPLRAVHGDGFPPARRQTVVMVLQLVLENLSCQLPLQPVHGDGFPSA
jgi:hypothetical protein